MGIMGSNIRFEWEEEGDDGFDGGGEGRKRMSLCCGR
jgi:hypothetical protein